MQHQTLTTAGQAMTEPTTAALASGISAAVLTLIGVDVQVLFWAFIGASVGLSWAAKTGPYRATALFVCVVLGAALLGSLVSALWFSGSVLVRNSSALAIGIAAHPALSAVMSSLPAIVKGWAEKVGASK
jgi:hypothetical protein